MELQQELLWKIVERELGMGLISCEPLNAGGSADVYRATVRGAAYCLYQTVSLGRRGGMARQEAEQIALLAQYSIIPFPRLYFVHDATPEEPLEALGMELMPGVSALNKTFYWKSPAKRRRMSDLSVDSLIRIHLPKMTALARWTRRTAPHGTIFITRWQRRFWRRRKRQCRMGVFARKPARRWKRRFAAMKISLGKKSGRRCSSMGTTGRQTS